MKDTITDSLPDCVLLDLETSQAGKILKIGATRGERVLLRQGEFDQAAALAELARFSEGASCLVGHNILLHDMAILQERGAPATLLGLPVVDTLFLSPICFPENPYHHLVKDYKLVSESVNDPVADARLSGVLLTDERGRRREASRRGAERQRVGRD